MTTQTIGTRTANPERITAQGPCHGNSISEPGIYNQPRSVQDGSEEHGVEGPIITPEARLRVGASKEPDCEQQLLHLAVHQRL